MVALGSHAKRAIGRRTIGSAIAITITNAVSRFGCDYAQIDSGHEQNLFPQPHARPPTVAAASLVYATIRWALGLRSD